MMQAFDPLQHAHQPGHMHFSDAALSFSMASNPLPDSIYLHDHNQSTLDSTSISHSALDDLAYTTNHPSSSIDLSQESTESQQPQQPAMISLPEPTSAPNNSNSPPISSSADPIISADSATQEPSSSSSSSSSAPQAQTSQMGISHATPLSRPLTHKEEELLAHLDRLKFFLATAPSRWSEVDPTGDFDAMTKSLGGGRIQPGTPMMPHPNTHPALNRFLLPSGEYVTCVLWSGLYHITGTDIVRALVFRFEAFGRPVRNMKKFEEGIFSDLRNLKPGTDACLEEPKSPFLDLLFKYQCIRTQKKQKVFYWFSVPHDRLFLDALERDLKREKMGQEPTTVVVGEPALSFTYDPKRSLYEQFSKANGNIEGEGELEAAVRRAEEAQREVDSQGGSPTNAAGSSPEDASGESTGLKPSAPILDNVRKADVDYNSSAEESANEAGGHSRKRSVPGGPGSPFFNMVTLFEGSPNYKQRRKKVPKTLNRLSGDPTAHGFVRVGASPDDGVVNGSWGGVDGVDDRNGDLSAAAIFEAQANLGMSMSRQEQSRRQAENQRMVQAHHLAMLQAQQNGGLHTPPTQLGPPGFAQQQDYHPSMDAPNGMHLEHRHTIPMMSEQVYHHQLMHSKTLPDTYPNNGMDDSSFGNVYPPATAASTTKAFVCPLFSCGRLFKRAEHLKRHLRTHTMERPFVCELCQKRFSRSDNLTAHLRTHTRENAMGLSGLPMADPSDADVEEDGEEDLFNPDGTLSDALGLGSGVTVNMCEVEVGGPVHEVHGDEEGLVTNSEPFVPPFMTNDMVYRQQQQQQHQQPPQPHMGINPAHFANVVGSPENSPHMMVRNSLPEDLSGAQWVNRPIQTSAFGYDMYSSPQASPAYSTMSMLSPQQQIMSVQSSATLVDSPRNIATPRHLTAPEYLASMSAPANKLSFGGGNNGPLYPQELGLGLTNGPGPIRRFRSVTPTISYGSDISRPSSASAGEIPLSGAAARAYHPYAMARHHSTSTHGSAHSSPAPVHSQLEFVQNQVAAERRMSRPTHSRSSSGHLQEQMQHLLNLDHVDKELNYVNPQAPHGVDTFGSDPMNHIMPQHGMIQLGP